MIIDYNLKNIRALLTKGFSGEELRIFCFDEPSFKPVYEQLAADTGKTQIVQKLIEHAEQKELFDSLLDWAKKQNASKYEKYQPYDSSTILSDIPRKPQKVGMIQNPFTQRKMIRDGVFFYGRKEELTQVIDHIYTGGCCSIVGEPKIGKSSFLWSLSDVNILADMGIDLPEYLVVYFDFQLDPTITRSGFFKAILVELAAKIDDQTLQNELERLCDQDHITFTDLRSILYRVVQKDYKIVFLFDEFDYVIHNRNAFDESFASGLRSLANNLGITYIAASRIGIHELFPEDTIVSSPFFNIFFEIKLGLLKQPEAANLILQTNRPVEISLSEEMDKILEKAGRHPYVLQVFCYHLFRAKQSRDSLSEEDLEQVGAKSYDQLLPYFREVWHRAQPQEKQALKIAAGLSNSIPDREALRKLEGQGYIVNDAKGFRLFGEIFLSFVKNVQDHNPLDKKVEEQSSSENDLSVEQDLGPHSKTQKISKIPTVQSSASHERRSWIPFKLQISSQDNLSFSVRAFETPMGEPRERGQLPYDTDGLIAILKALRNEAYDPTDFSQTQLETLHSLNLIHGSRFAADMEQRIGQGLYKAVFPGKVGSAFDMALSQAWPTRGVVGLQLRFDPDSVELARYPWELLHDGQRFLLTNGAVELTRYISYAVPPTPLRVSPPLHLLYITARPINLKALPADDERQVVWDSLQTQISSKHLVLDQLRPPTYDQLLDVLGENDYHIIHFDGHGVFAKQCPTCRAMNQSHLLECAICTGSLADVEPCGFLAFEDEDGRVDYVDTFTLENALFDNQVRLAVISACASATVRGETVFGGVGPGLIRTGIPAVVAMQLPITIKSAINFSRGFYTALSQGHNIPKAVVQGRRRLYRDRTYFIPTLYLRSSDDAGQLFVT